MTRRRPSNILSSSSVRAMNKRKADRQRVSPNVSYDAALGIIQRECDKRDCRWYGVKDADGKQVAELLGRLIEAEAPSRKEARLWVLAKIADGTFPRRES